MKQTARLTPGLVVLILLLLIVLNGLALAWLGWPVFQNNQPASPLIDPGNPTLTILVTSQPEPTQTASPTPVPATPTFTPFPLHLGDPQVAASLEEQGVLLLALRDGNQVHFFAYHPDLLPLTRLTNTPWDTIDPALSPDGTRLAFSSRQNGYWDLYLLDLRSGEVTRITDTPEYEGTPSWSPDGQWLAYSAYVNNNLDVYLRSLTDPSLTPIRLTDDPAADSQPSWSPGGRQIAFVSTRTGDAEIWVADLDRTEGRFTNISQKPAAQDLFPVWSHDGQQLAWATDQTGDRLLRLWDYRIKQASDSSGGTGDQPAWSPDDRILFSAVSAPNQNTLAAYLVGSGMQRMPPLNLPGQVYGLVWVRGPLSGWLLDQINRADTTLHPPLTSPVLTQQAGPPAGRLSMVPLEDVSAPQPMLHDAVDEAFQALRLEAARLSGWDVLSSLENAFIPLTSPPEPTLYDDWLYTGRAFAINPVIYSAGWLAVIREDFNGQTYWRLYLKTRFQDGSSGIPLMRPVWDLNARFSGDPRAYEQGGETDGVPEGYWLDLTELASRFGWERLPARPNWRVFFPGIRFNQFVIRDGLDWNQAMAQIYPPEALATPTSMPTYTNTPTFTLHPTRTRVALSTPTPPSTSTSTPTLRPTLTLPSGFTR